MRYDSEHKERVHQQILAEAASAIRAKGADRIGVAEVMNRLGLTHGGFYAHFESKDDLIAQALTHMFDQNYARFLRRTEGCEPKQGLTSFIDFYLSPAHRDGPNHGCPLPTLTGELPRLPEAARRRFDDGLQRLSAGIAHLLGALGAQEPHALAFSVVAEMVGAVALSRVIADPHQSDEMLGVARRSVKRRLGWDDAP